jgi:uncharacterized phage protein (TIGR01671 family)
MQYLFRGKRKDNNHWTYGSLIIDIDSCRIHVYGTGESRGVFPNTVGQCVSLKDKNGFDIYEGDLLKRTQRIDGNFVDRIFERYEVAYNSGIAGFEYKPIDGKEYKQYTVRPFGGEEIEVIGNIHEVKKPAEGAVINTMSNFDPNSPATQNEDAVKAEGQQVAATESAAQDTAMEVTESAEEGSTEG